ncbi:hypothetical protein C5167_045183 [Papaver somniferum]|uniref:Uncharacterized protein n=1 Tax=Papaver somniferum TaxID=3469 RepID=A0A4Y7LCX5_PAPSO|nr:hypothetical protein C5167_045183 [Papaver somniferum]
MKNHGSALSIHKRIMSFRLVSEVESERLFGNMWAMLVYEIKKLEEAFLISISSANPSTELSSVEGMPTEYNLHQEDSVWNGEDSSDRDASLSELVRECDSVEYREVAFLRG